MDVPVSLIMTWVERGKWTTALSMPMKRTEWDYTLSIAADNAVGSSGVYRRSGLIMNSVRFGLVDSSGFPVPFPSTLRLPKI